MPPAAGRAPEAALAASVRVEMANGYGGSGTHVGAGLVVTCRHLAVQVGQRGSVAFPDGQSYRCSVVALAQQDLAALYCPDASMEPAVGLADGIVPAGGEVWMVGYPGETGRRRRASRGRLNGLGFTPWGKTNDFVLHATSGDSGAGVFNPQGQLVGVLWGSDNRDRASVCTYRDTKTFLSEQCVRWWPGKAIGRPDPHAPTDPGSGNVLGPGKPTPEDKARLVAKLAEYERRLAALESSKGTAGPPGPAGPPGRDGHDGSGADAAFLQGVQQAQTRILAILDAYDKRISSLEKAPAPGSNRRTIIQPVKP